MWRAPGTRTGEDAAWRWSAAAPSRGTLRGGALVRNPLTSEDAAFALLVRIVAVVAVLVVLVLLIRAIA